MQKRTIKKIFAAILAAVMVLSCIPFSALAAGECTIVGNFIVDGTTNPAVGATVKLYDENFTNLLQTTTTDQTGKFTFTNCDMATVYFVTVDEGKYYAFDDEYTEIIQADGKTQPGYDVSTVGAGESTFFKGAEPRPLKLSVGKVTLTKYAKDTTTTIPGAVFELFNSDDSLRGEYTTDGNGKIVVNSLPVGSYYFKEKSAPSDYFLDSTTKINFSIENNGDAKTVTAENVHKGKITIAKTDSDTGAALKDAVFELYDSTDTLITTVTTDNDGKAEFNDLRPGSYTVKEKTAPENYSIDTAEYPVTLATTSYAVNIDATNTHYPSVTVTKVNERTDDFVPGAKIVIYDDSDNPVKTFDTLDAVETFYLAPGNYKLVEEEAPDGYIKAADMPFTVTNGVDQTLTVSEKEYKLTVIKKSESLDNAATQETVAGSDYFFMPTEGCELLVSDGSGRNYPVTTGADGSATIYAIPKGEYTITEPTPATGYQPLEANVSVNIADSEENTVTFYNGFVTYDIEFEKVNHVDKPIIADFNISGSHNTDTNFQAGLYTASLKPGTYLVTETGVPAGYVLDSTAKTLVVNVDGSATFDGNAVTGGHIDIVNYPIRLQINKVDADTLNQIAGVELTLAKTDGTYSKTFTTEATATVIEEGLTPGEYTLTETAAKTGYSIAAPKTFTVNNTTDLQSVTLTNERLLGNVQIYKTGDAYDSVSTVERFLGFIEHLFDIITARSLDGVEFTIYAKEDIEHPDGVSGLIYAKDAAVTTITTDATGYATASDLPFGTYYIKETGGKEGFIPSDEVKEFIIDDTHGILEPAEIEYYNNTKRLNITINKTDSRGNNMSGVLYGLFADEDILSSAGTAVVEKDTLISVIAVYDGIGQYSEKTPLAKYYVKELEAPAGYLVSDTKYPVDFTVNNADYTADAIEMNFTFDAVDEAITIIVEKRDADDNAFVLNADMELVADDGFVRPWTTIAEGQEFYALPAGTYTLKEVKTPAGYESAPEMTIVVEAKANPQVFVMEDARVKGIIELTKDDTDGKLLEGVEYTLFDSEDNELDRALTDENGYLKFDNLPVGTYENGEIVSSASYKLVETQTLPGYIMPSEGSVVSFNFTDPAKQGDFYNAEYLSNLITLSYRNQYTRVSFSKIDAATKKALPDVEFALYSMADIEAVAPEIEEYMNSLDIDLENVENFEDLAEIIADIYTEMIKILPDPVARWTSGKEAYTIDKLPIGEYILVEESAPEGYIQMLPQEIEVKETADVQKFTFENDFTKVEILKIDKDTGKPVAGAKLALYRAEDLNEDGTLTKDAKPVKEWTSTEKAERFEKLAPGNYVLFELEAPKGYIIGKAATITVAETAEIQLFKYDNEKVEVITNDTEIPRTGDDGIPVIMLGVLCLATTAFVLTRKKKENEE